MCEVYRVSSSVRVKQMESELSQQILTLREEIQENGARPTNTFSSVLLPKDISFFRVEREHALRRGLQVAEALPVQVQADVMQREMESCLSFEYTADSLPPLLHQFYTDRSYHLAQIKYHLMLRWRRFCRHTSVIEKLYPHYKAQVLHLTCEYEDAVQRARRLSVSREHILTGGANLSNLLTQDDVLIHLRWLVCHLHSVQTVHNFLRVLHYLPSCERNEKAPGTKVETFHETRHVDGLLELAEKVPLHSVHLEDFLSELQSLITNFHLSYNTENLKSTADEMELFGMVWKEFRTIFKQQEQMKTFPQYDSSDMRDSQWGRESPNMALRKNENWTPFIQVKPRRDPWQQKIVTNLKEKNCEDELLKMHRRFLQVSDLLDVAAALKQHACHVEDSQSTSVSHNSKTQQQKTSQIWTSLYKTITLAQETHIHSSRFRGTEGAEKETQDSRPANQSLVVLGLDDTSEKSTSNPIITRGAYLSLIFLRHLRLRELQRVSLGMLNYLRSVERTLTFDLAGVRLEEEKLCSTAEETGWMSAARGGIGDTGGPSSLQYIHNTPVDYKVRCSEFMEFSEVENLQDFFSSNEGYIHTQDHRGFYIVYDAALKDLQELEDEILLVGSHFIQRNRIQQMKDREEADTRSDIDHVAVLLDLWIYEAEFLEHKVELLNCYFEAYQHTTGTEERFALARVITDIMHSRPRLDLNQDYFIQGYKAEISCLQSHKQVIREVLDTQIKRQRQYLERIWMNDDKDSNQFFGLPPNYIPKHLVLLGGSSPALMNTYLLEVHPSLCLASRVYEGLVQAHAEFCELHQAMSVAARVSLQQKLFQRALQSLKNLASPGASYSPQIQKDLFSDAFFDHPALVQNVGLLLVKSAEDRDMKQGQEKQMYAVETLSKLLELVTLRHRLLESASETAHLAQLYRGVALELGFEECHLYLRPLQFEAVEQKQRVQQKPAFITAILEDDSSVDRFTPSQLPLSIQELDENQIGRFSFSSEGQVISLMNEQSLENLQVTLACQVAQKNALMSAVKLACLCHWGESASSSAEGESKDFTPTTNLEDKTECLQEKEKSSPSKISRKSHSVSKMRLMEAFVSIQLEKVGLRDEMLNLFMKKKKAMGGFFKAPEDAAKIKRKLIIDFLGRFSSQISLYSTRAQIITYYYSLTLLLKEFPSISKSHFIFGDVSDPIVTSEGDLSLDLRIFQKGPQKLLSAEGKTLLNLWYIPHFTEILHMFKTLDSLACAEALRHTLQIVSALHDIIYYLVSFSKLGNREDSSCSWRRGQNTPGSHLAAEWGGPEGIGAELQEIQQQVDRLSDPSSPLAVGRLLTLRREVVLLQFDSAVRNLIREAFLSSGDVASYQSVSDNMVNALPLLSNSLQTDVFSLMLPVPQPLESRSHQAQRMYPWRSFIACHGLLPLRLWDVPPIHHCMQLSLSGLCARSRLQANAALLGVSLLMEDVLHGGREAEPLRLHGNKDDLVHTDKTDKVGGRYTKAEVKEKTVCSSSLPQDPIRAQSVLKGFLLLTKQLELFKENWARGRLGVNRFRTAAVYQQFVKLYRAEIYYPSMRALAQQMGKECDYELLISGSQALLPPPGASEVDVKTWQLQLLLESAECDMIQAVQRKINRELTLVVAERTRQDSCLPTELWRKTQLKDSLSLERPQMVETFIQQLMKGAQQQEGKVQLSQDHLQQCLNHLSSCVMERERRSFQLHSQFYEQTLQQQTQLLYQREQDLKSFKDTQMNNSHKQMTDLCLGMMLEISNLQARVAHLEEEKKTSEKRISLKFKERYEPVMRNLFSTCIQLKSSLDEYRQQMERDVSEMVSKARGEGVDRLIRLKKKYGCSGDNDDLILTHLKKEEVHNLKQENSRLISLLGKQKAVSRWRKVVDQEKVHRELLQSQQSEVCSRVEALRVKLISEEKVVLLQEELDVARKALARCEAECSSAKKQLSRKVEELQVARHQSAREARSRQELDTYRVQRLEVMRADVEDRDRQLRALSQQLDRDSRMNRLQRQRSAKQIQKVKGRLQQEHSLKQEAFQQVERLQTQLSSMEATQCREPSAADRNLTSLSRDRRPSRTYYTLSVSRLSSRSPSAGPHRNSQQPPGTQTYLNALQDFNTAPGQQRAESSRSRSHATDRPSQDPSRLRFETAALLPHL